MRVKECIEDRYIEITSDILTTGISNPTGIFCMAYLALICKRNQIFNESDLERAVFSFSENRKEFINNIVSDFSFPIIIAKKYEEDILISFLFDYIGNNFVYLSKNSSTPYGVVKLANKILDIKDGESVADFGCGIGNFFIQTNPKHKNTLYYGIEIDTILKEIASIRCELLLKNIELVQGDMFLLEKNKKFNKIFSNYPFGMRLKNLQSGSKYLEELYKKIPNIKKATSSDWVFNALLLSHLEDKGKAVAIMTNGGCWNSIDFEIRKFFIENRYIEAIISLPSRIFLNSNIAVSMIIISKNNTAVRMVDASKLCVKGRRFNEISDKNVEDIFQLLKHNSEISTLVNLEELQRNEYVLNPSRYLEKEVEIKDGVEFGKIIKRITRGAPLRASDLDNMVSKEPTDTQYLMLSNIQNGLISNNLPYLEKLDSKYNKYYIEDRNLLLSKNGAPYKVAVAEVKKGRKILGNGNLFIIELDEEKVNPYYIKAFFDSYLGELSLQKITVGAAIPNISAESLKKMLIPLPSMEKQLKIAEKYKEKIEEIKLLNFKLQKAQSELKNVFKEE